MKRLLVLFLCISLLIVSCYYDSEESLYPELNSCNTLNVTFAGSIVPILDSHCLSCHSSAVAESEGSGIKLEGYSNVVSNTAILGAIRHESANSAMPKNAPKLDDCLIRQFEIWHAAGSPDN
jgi:hypothetical protein